MSGNGRQRQADSVGLVTNIMVSAPTSMMMLRSAWLSADAGGRLDLGGVGGQPAHHLAGVRLLVEGGPERGQVPEDLGAQVRDHALAQPVDGVEARRAGQRQHQADARSAWRNSWSMKAPSPPEKPKSIMRRTATGTVSMAAAETTSASERQPQHARVAQQVGLQRQQRAQRACVRVRRRGSLVGGGSTDGLRRLGVKTRRRVPGAPCLGKWGMAPRAVQARNAQCWHACPAVAFQYERRPAHIPRPPAPARAWPRPDNRPARQP